MATLVGTQLSGRYRLDEKIGAGGMSTVYRARDMTLERDVAVKLMHREIAADFDRRERGDDRPLRLQNQFGFS